MLLKKMTRDMRDFLLELSYGAMAPQQIEDKELLKDAKEKGYVHNISKTGGELYRPIRAVLRDLDNYAIIG